MKSKKTESVERPKRPVLSIFYKGHEVVRTNHSAHPNNAVINAIKHMQSNQYNAGLVEVFGADDEGRDHNAQGAEELCTKH